MSETVRCPYCRETFTADDYDAAKDEQNEHIGRAHDAFRIAADGDLEELAGLLRAAVDTATQRGGR